MRTIMEKLRPVDAKLRAHTDRLLRTAVAESNDGGPSPSIVPQAQDHDDPLSYYPNPEALLGAQTQRVRDQYK